MKNIIYNTFVVLQFISIIVVIISLFCLLWTEENHELYSRITLTGVMIGILSYCGREYIDKN